MSSFNLKPLIIWAASFLSLGFCSICNTFLFELSENFRIEHVNTNPLVFAILSSIVSPILPVIASIFLFRYLYSTAISIFQSQDSDTTPK